MRKIIGGKLYDTDTATKVGYYDSGLSVYDFRHYSERLYKKRTGEFFLYGSGGPRTRYATIDGSGAQMGGEKIIPITLSEAKRWVEDHESADTYCDLFGTPEE